ncbi:SpoIIE family protein phosphatase [Streptomyces humi]|uniref:SpoIIE family protein phosphatase n=1 Tax=Streptomyces humi TaxID=1428620 RepID=UPI001F0B6091|nr:SpoIIE family protein phosphatase [Streptomyces humi]
MGAIPTQRETVSPVREAPARDEAPAHESTVPRAQGRATLPGSPLAPGSARALVRASLDEWTDCGLLGREQRRVAEDAMIVVSELVTNAVVHAGTDVEIDWWLEQPAVEQHQQHAQREKRQQREQREQREQHEQHEQREQHQQHERHEGTALVVEVTDHHPSRAPRDHAGETPYETPEFGRGLRLVASLAESWGVTYRTGAKSVWARLTGRGGTLPDEQELRVAGILAPEPPASSEPHTPSPAPSPAPDQGCPHRPERDRDWLNRGALTFLAEASDLLAGQLDENLVAALTGQLIVPRLADWCAVWLEDEATVRGGWNDPTGAGGPRLARVWHSSENRIEELRRALEKDPPGAKGGLRSGPEPYPWPGAALGPQGAHGAALAYRLIAGGRPLGTLVIGRAGPDGFPDEITGLVEDFGRRVALAIGAARQYARQATISAVLQRGLLPGAVAEIPGLRSALVYEPCDMGGPSGDFYDLFPAGDGRWCFAVGDVQGKGPEAAVVIGLARPWLRLLAREGYRVADVLDRLNQLLLDDATEAADAAARALVAAGGHPLPAGDGPQTRFLSLLYGELTLLEEGGARCTLASAGHPLPLLLGPDGEVRTAARPQTLLGVVEDETYTSETIELAPGDSLLCVTDGVTERRSGSRQFDDGDGLAQALAGCVGLSAELIAERIRRLVHEFGGGQPEDDLALLVLQAE